MESLGVLVFELWEDARVEVAHPGSLVALEELQEGGAEGVCPGAAGVGQEGVV